MAQKVGIILNLSARKASQLNVGDIVKTINKHLPNATIYRVEKSIETSAACALKDGCNVLCGGGGDGTVSAVATFCAKHNLVLGILPLGTLNNFSKDVGISQNLSRACKLIKIGKTKRIDYATVNGKLFLNNSSVGVYAHYVREREKYQSHFGKMLAYVASFVTFLPKYKTLQLRLEYGNKKELVQAPIIFVSNNDYSLSEKPFMRRSTLSGGKLAVHIFKKSDKHSVVESLKNTILINKIRHGYKNFTTSKITIYGAKQKAIIAKDGEVITVKFPLKYKIHPKALEVIVS